MSVKGLWWLCFCFAFECWNPREVEKWGDILRQHRGRAEKKTSESFWKEIEIILIFYYLHFSLLETSWIENKLQFLSFVRNEPGQGTVEPKQAENLRSVWKKNNEFSRRKGSVLLTTIKSYKMKCDRPAAGGVFHLVQMFKGEPARPHILLCELHTGYIFHQTIQSIHTRPPLCFCQLNVRFTKDWQKHW